MQDLIKRDSDKLYDPIVNKDAAIYICGDAKGMAKGVQDALVEMLVQHHNVNPMQANKILIDWISTRKYLRDLVSPFFLLIINYLLLTFFLVVIIFFF